MIEARLPEASVEKNPTPETITISMILNDLDNGTDRKGIQTKYGLDTWEVKQMFEHPKLKGKKPRKVRKLSFDFVDDTVEAVDPNQTSIPTFEEENPHYETQEFTQREQDQMQAEAWEQQNQVSGTTNPLNNL